MSLYDLYATVENAVNEYVDNSDSIFICSSEVGLDERCGEICISVSEGWIASRSPGILEYYGGFEYVSSDFKERLGEYTFYSSESNRVRKHIEIFKEHQENEPTPEDKALGGIEYVLENVKQLDKNDKYTELFYLERDRAIEIEIDSYGRVLVSDVINPADACGEYSPRISARIIAAGFIDDRDKILADVRNYIQTGCINPVNPIG